MPDHSRQRLKLALIAILIAGALVVFFVSLRSFYKTFSTSIHPVSLSSKSSTEPSTKGVGQSPADDQAQALLKSLFGGLPASKSAQVQMDAKTLRTMLGVQGINPTILQSLSDDDLMRLYGEFMSGVTTPPSQSVPVK